MKRSVIIKNSTFVKSYTADYVSRTNNLLYGIVQHTMMQHSIV